MTPEFSVVIAAYNHGKYIKQTIRSVLDQTFQDFEIIVFDDGSKDNTRDIVSTIKDKRVKYMCQPNSGLPAIGRNRGMSLSSGKYIALLDGDDYWKNNKLEKCKSVLDTKKDVALMCHDESVVYDGKILRNTNYGPYEKDMYERLLFGGNTLHTSAVVMRRELFFDEGMKFSEDRNLFTVEDYDYWLRLSKKHKFYFLKESLGFYRVTEEGAFLSSGQGNTVNMLGILDRNFASMFPAGFNKKVLMKKRKSSVMSAAGRMFHHKQDFQSSIKWYIRSIKEYPFNYKAYIALIAALLHIRILYR